MKINLFFYSFFPLFFLFFPAMCLPLGNKPIAIFFIISTLFMCLYILFSFKRFIYQIIYIIKYTPFKYFFYWCLWCLVSGIFLVLTNKYSFAHFIYYYILYLLINITIPLLIPILTVKNFSHLRIFIKFYMIMLLIVFSIGFVNFLSTSLNIKFVQDLFCNLIVNERSFGGGLNTVVTYGTKVYSVFAEPGWFGGFICLNLPIIYSLSTSKYKIFTNISIEIFMKKTVILMALCNLILTKSPIWLIFSILTIVFLNWKNVINSFKKFYICYLFIFLSICGFFFNSKILALDLSETYLNRIITTIKTDDYNNFVFAEASLASRITSYYNSLRLLEVYPITGTGLGNSKFYMANMFLSSKLPLTMENYRNLIESYNIGYLRFNGAFFYESLSETGIIGFVLIYIYLLFLVKILKNYKIYLKGICKDFATGINNSILIFLPISLYDISFRVTYMWLIFGIANLLIIVAKNEYKYSLIEKKLENSNENI